MKRNMALALLCAMTIGIMAGCGESSQTDVAVNQTQEQAAEVQVEQTTENATEQTTENNTEVVAETVTETVVEEASEPEIEIPDISVPSFEAHNVEFNLELGKTSSGNLYLDEGSVPCDVTVSYKCVKEEGILEARDGFVWQVVAIKKKAQGYYNKARMNSISEDYYATELYDDSSSTVDWGKHVTETHNSIVWNGEIVETVKRRWHMSTFSEKESFRISYAAISVPEGYDGIVVGTYNPNVKWSRGYVYDFMNAPDSDVMLCRLPAAVAGDSVGWIEAKDLYPEEDMFYANNLYGCNYIPDVWDKNLNITSPDYETEVELKGVIKGEEEIYVEGIIVNPNDLNGGAISADKWVLRYAFLYPDENKMSVYIDAYE